MCVKFSVIYSTFSYSIYSVISDIPHTCSIILVITEIVYRYHDSDIVQLAGIKGTQATNNASVNVRRFCGQNIMWMSVKFSVIILFLGLPYCGRSNVSNSSKIYSVSERRNVSGHSLQDDGYICVSWPYRYGRLDVGNLRLGYCSTYDKDTRTRSLAGCPYFQTA